MSNDYRKKKLRNLPIFIDTDRFFLLVFVFTVLANNWIVYFLGAKDSGQKDNKVLISVKWDRILTYLFI